MKNIIYILPLLWFGLIPKSDAQTLSNVRASFVDIGFGARPVAMGNAFVGLADDINSVFWNPAGLATLPGYNVAFTHTKQLQLIDYHYFAGNVPIIANRMGAGLAIISSGDDLMREITIQAGYGVRIKRLSIGFAAKLRNSSFGNNNFNEDDFPVFDPSEIEQGRLDRVRGNANGFGLDVGLLYKVSTPVSIGISVKDALAMLTWDSQNDNPENPAKGVYNEDLPYEVAVGFSYKPNQNLVLVADWLPSMYSDVDNFLRIGTEARFFSFLLIRAGTQQAINVYDDEKYMFGSGFSYPIRSDLTLFIDYTYMIEEIAQTHRFSIALRF